MIKLVFIYSPGVTVTELHKRGGMDEESYGKFLEHSKSTHALGRFVFLEYFFL